MISIVVNGEAREFDKPPTGSELLARLGLENTPVVTELNGEVINRTEFLSKNLNDKDNIEFVTIVGGG